MTEKTEKTAKKANVKSPIFGGSASVDLPPGPINLFVLLGTLTAQTDGTFFAWQNYALDDVTHITNAGLLDVSAVSITGGDGKSVFRLSEFVGWATNAAEPVNILATAQGNAPFFLTVDHRIQWPDLEITIYSWDVNGKPAPYVAFDWRCRCVSVGAD